MSLRLRISNPEKHNVWFRSIYVLSTIHEDIKLAITSEEVIVWAMNDTDTSLCQARFAKSFFDEFFFEPQQIVFGDDGLQVIRAADGSEHRIYSLQINARNLTTVSRKPDNDGIKDFVIAINNIATCPEILINRLLVHVRLDSLIVKEYSSQFSPIKYEPIIINLKYKRKFLDAFATSSAVDDEDEPLDPKLIEIFRDTELELSRSLFNLESKPIGERPSQFSAVDEINYLCCDQAILRNFIDNCNANVTDEIRLEINERRLTVTAFTKAIYGKNNDLLRNAISMSNTIRTTDLQHHCIFITEESSPLRGGHSKGVKESVKSITFKLRDFKSFISLGLASKNLQGSNNNNINIWFCHPGDPILMEISKYGFKVELVQVTDSNLFQTATTEVTTRRVISPRKGKPTFNEPLVSNISRVSPLKNMTEPSHNDTRFPTTRVNPLIHVAEKISPTRPVFPTRSASIKPKRLFVNEFSQDGDVPHDNRSVHEGQPQGTTSLAIDREPGGGRGTDHPQGEAKARSDTVVGWGKRNIDVLQFEDAPVDKRRLTDDRREVLKKEKLKYLTKEGINGKGDDDNSYTEEEPSFGPTQRENVKGLFD